MKKILHLIDKMHPERGGVCQAVRTISKGLSEAGVLNEIVSMDDPMDNFLKDSLFKIHALGPANNPLSYSKKLVPWLVNNLKRFDVVITHGLWQYPTWAIYRALKRVEKLKDDLSGNPSQIPRNYIMPHGMLDPYFQKAKGRKLKSIRNDIYWKLIENNAVNSAGGLLFTCETERILAKESFTGYFPKQELVIGLGVERPPEYEPQMKEAFLAKCPELAQDNYLLFLSRIHEKKGVDILLKAYDLMGLDSNVSREDLPKLVIAGPGLESDYGREILKIVGESAFLKKNVFFTGMISGNIKWGAFYNCAAFILPSHQENFGIAVVEALACGKPVLISDQINIWREIDQEKAGIVRKDDLKGTVSLLKTWLGLTSTEKQELIGNSKSCFEKYYAVDKVSNKYMKVLFRNNGL